MRVNISITHVFTSNSKNQALDKQTDKYIHIHVTAEVLKKHLGCQNLSYNLKTY
jgi:hypothetical protein